MTDPQRPVFYEGQVLAAADLTATVDYARNHAARHDRYLHAWGIVTGLTLTTQQLTDPVTNATYVAVTLQPGVAIDGTGREVVVLNPVALSEDQFTERIGTDPGTGTAAELYPVFLAGLDRDPVATSIVTDACGTAGQPGRIDESYQITFGRSGDERLVGEQVPPGIGDGPGDGTTPWLILVGYVAWQNGHFTAVSPTARGVAVRYAGVRAETVAARTGTLALRADTDATQGGAVLTVADATGLVFGRYLADGSVDQLMVVSPDGNLTVRGNVAGQQQSGGAAAVSGVATDGMILPLPSGVDPAQVASGSTVLHVMLTPRAAGASPTTDAIWLPGPIESTVDSARRVRCRIRWFPADTANHSWQDLPGAVDFLVVATVAGASGGSASS